MLRKALHKVALRLVRARPFAKVTCDNRTDDRTIVVAQPAQCRNIAGVRGKSQDCFMICHLSLATQTTLAGSKCCGTSWSPHFLAPSSNTPSEYLCNCRYTFAGGSAWPCPASLFGARGPSLRHILRHPRNRLGEPLLETPGVFPWASSIGAFGSHRGTSRRFILRNCSFDNSFVARRTGFPARRPSFATSSDPTAKSGVNGVYLVL